LEENTATLHSTKSSVQSDAKIAGSMHDIIAIMSCIDAPSGCGISPILGKRHMARPIERPSDLAPLERVFVPGAVELTGA
jgi:hypothetical protein